MKNKKKHGRVSEWFKETVLKTVDHESGPWVRHGINPWRPGFIPGRIYHSMYYVYILKSDKDKNLYTGYSSDLKRRIAEHNAGKVESTKNRRPLKLICYEAYLDEETARKREEFLKTSDGKIDIKRRLKKYTEGCLSGLRRQS